MNVESIKLQREWIIARISNTLLVQAFILPLYDIWMTMALGDVVTPQT